ncbi:MAG: hypothetical protein HQK50_13470 [Oligoflexia bacterium]|nr:hypothetical protein [Oligoflexia bacterium]
MKNKKSTLDSLYKDFEQSPSEKLERKIIQLETAAPAGTVLKIVPQKRQVVAALKRSLSCLSSVKALESFYYLDYEEKTLLFQHYLYHSVEDAKIVKALIYLLGQLSSSTKESLPLAISEINFLRLQKELNNLEVLYSSKALLLRDYLRISRGFCRHNSLFEFHDMHIKWLSSRCPLKTVICVIELYLLALKSQQLFEQALDFFKLPEVRNLELLAHSRFYGFYFQFYLMKSFQSEVWKRRNIFSDADQATLLQLIEDKHFLKAFPSKTATEQKILLQLVSENTHSSRHSFVAYENPYAYLDLHVYDPKLLKTSDILNAVSLQLKKMSYGKETPLKVLEAQKILLNEDFKHLGNICHGYSFLQGS